MISETIANLQLLKVEDIAGLFESLAQCSRIVVLLVTSLVNPIYFLTVLRVDRFTLTLHKHMVIIR